MTKGLAWSLRPETPGCPQVAGNCYCPLEVAVEGQWPRIWFIGHIGALTFVCFLSLIVYFYFLLSVSQLGIPFHLFPVPEESSSKEEEIPSSTGVPIGGFPFIFLFLVTTQKCWFVLEIMVTKTGTEGRHVQNKKRVLLQFVILNNPIYLNLFNSLSEFVLSVFFNSIQISLESALEF